MNEVILKTKRGVHSYGLTDEPADMNEVFVAPTLDLCTLRHYPESYSDGRVCGHEIGKTLVMIANKHDHATFETTLNTVVESTPLGDELRDVIRKHAISAIPMAKMYRQAIHNQEMQFFHYNNKFALMHFYRIVDQGVTLFETGELRAQARDDYKDFLYDARENGAGGTTVLMKKAKQRFEDAVSDTHLQLQMNRDEIQAFFERVRADYI